jgi:hypothetical protein
MFVVRNVRMDFGNMQFIVESFQASNTNMAFLKMSFFYVLKHAGVFPKK